MDTYRIRVDGEIVDGTWSDYDIAIYQAAVLHNGRGAKLTEVINWVQPVLTWGNDVLYKIEGKA